MPLDLNTNISKLKMYYTVDIMDDIPKIGITGMPSVGKTQTLVKIIEKLEGTGYAVEGMFTEQVIKDKKRVGFERGCLFHKPGHH